MGSADWMPRAISHLPRRDDVPGGRSRDPYPPPRYPGPSNIGQRQKLGAQARRQHHERVVPKGEGPAVRSQAKFIEMTRDRVKAGGGGGDEREVPLASPTREAGRQVLRWAAASKGRACRQEDDELEQSDMSPAQAPSSSPSACSRRRGRGLGLGLAALVHAFTQIEGGGVAIAQLHARKNEGAVRHPSVAGGGLRPARRLEGHSRHGGMRRAASASCSRGHSSSPGEGHRVRFSYWPSTLEMGACARKSTLRSTGREPERRL